MRINLGSKIITNKNAPYVIAEIGVNHECSIPKAKKLIRLAKKGGADAAKFQFYKADKIASIHSKAYWDISKEKEKSQFSLFKKFDKFNDKNYAILAEYCKKIKIDFACTPFDFESVDIIDKYVKYFKVASADITNIPLIRKIAKKQKPILLSTGASNTTEIDYAIKEIKKFNKKKIVIMHCILNYPTEDHNANLNMISDLKKNFSNCEIGYSDHTLPNNNMLTLATAYTLGATIIEKHFTDNKKKKGNDHYHSMDFKDLKKFREFTKKINLILGSRKKNFIKSEKISRLYARRSIVLSKSLKKNKKLNLSDISFKRPGTGICPKNYKKIIGRKLKKDLNYDHILHWKDLS